MTDKTKAQRALIKRYGRFLVNRLLPLVVLDGFTSICELDSRVIRDLKNGEGVKFDHPYPHQPLFPEEGEDLRELKSLWETAAGWTSSESSVYAMAHSDNSKPGVVSSNEPEAVVRALTDLLKAKITDKDYHDGTTRSDRVWDENRTS